MHLHSIEERCTMKANMPFFNHYRGGLRVMLETMKLPLMEAKRLHARQLKTLTEALSDYEAGLKQIADAATVEELIGIQAELARALAREALLYWSGFCETSEQGPLGALMRLQGKIMQTGEGFRDMMGMTPGALEPLMSLWKSAADIFCDACAITSRAAADAARLATDQAELATLAVPEEGATRKAGAARPGRRDSPCLKRGRQRSVPWRGRRPPQQALHRLPPLRGTSSTSSRRCPNPPTRRRASMTRC